MSTTSIESIASARKKTKESVRAESLLPEGLREKSATLIQLLKDYYAYMNAQYEPSYELNSINISRDLDEADAIFLDKLQKEIAYAVPRAVVADRLRLYKNLIRYYRLKGSSESIQLFFRIIFNDPVEVYYPRDSLLIPSDGKWDATFAQPVYTDDPIVFVTGDGTGAYARAKIENGVIAVIPVTSGGSGYSVAPAVTITDNGGPGTGAVAHAAISGGQVIYIEIVSGGKNYTNPHITIGGNATLGTPVVKDGAVSSITIYDYGQDYTKASVEVQSTCTVPAVIQAKLSNPTNTSEPGNSVTGYIISYCGEGYPLAGQFLGNSYGRYNDRKGFLSDTIRLQDSYFWQKYSYVIRTANNVETWKDIFAKLVHPAGFIYFGEILLLIELLNLNCKMPLFQPGVAGDAERTIKLLLEALNVSVISLTDTSYISTLNITSAGLDLNDQVRANDDSQFAFVYGNLTVDQADGNQGAVDPLYPYGNRSVATAINSGTAPYVVNGVTYTVELV